MQGALLGRPPPQEDHWAWAASGVEPDAASLPGVGHTDLRAAALGPHQRVHLGGAQQGAQEGDQEGSQKCLPAEAVGGEAAGCCHRSSVALGQNAAAHEGAAVPAVPAGLAGLAAQQG